MSKTFRRTCRWLLALSPFALVIAALGQSPSSQVGREVAISIHLQDGEEFTTSIGQLIQYGAQLFNAKFAVQEGAGRPLSKGTGGPASDPSPPFGVTRNLALPSSPANSTC